jgi:hypothetical protein
LGGLRVSTALLIEGRCGRQKVKKVVAGDAGVTSE